MTGSRAVEAVAALGTSWWLEIYDKIDSCTEHSAYAVVRTTLAEFENRYSRFRPDSWLSQLNRERSFSSPDPEFQALLTYGLQAYARTAGTFTILIGNEMIARGYDATYSFVPGTQPASPPDPHTILSINPRKITLHDNWTIDIGGYGKGYVIDLISTKLTELGLRCFLVNGGGDLYVTSDHGAPVTIHLEHPTQPGFGIGTADLKCAGFAASSPFKRQWRVAEKTYSHLMSEANQHDPVATFAVATTARDADVFATTCALLSEADCERLAHKEQCKVIRYNPITQQLWRYGM